MDRNEKLNMQQCGIAYPEKEIKTQKYLVKIWSVCLIMVLFPTIILAQINDYSRWNLKGKVKKIKELSYSVAEKNGKMVKDSLEYYFINEFNEAGNKIVDTKYLPNGNVDKKYVYKYDSLNRRTEEKQYLKDEKLLRTIFYTYNSKGNLIEDRSVNSEGKPEKTMKYEYDDYGKLIEDRSYNADGELLKKFMYKYDFNGNRFETDQFSADGSLDRMILFNFDDKNNLIDESCFKPNNTQIDDRSFSYKLVYDSHGNWIKRTKICQKKEINVLEREIEYFK